MEELKPGTEPDSKAQEEKEEAEETEDKTEESEEDFDSLPEWVREKFKKQESDLANYRSGMLKYKAEARTLRSQEPEEEEKEEEKTEEEWDEVSQRFKAETIAEAKRNAEEAARGVIKSEREKLAIERFTLEHPEMGDDKEWAKVVQNYKSSGGISVKSIQADLESAYDATYGDRGKAEEARQKGKLEGENQARLADAHSIANTQTHGKKTQKTAEEEMSAKFEGNLPPGFK